MSQETVNVAGETSEDVVFTHVRAKSVPDATFKMTYAQMANEGKTAEEIAAALGMNKASVVTRASAIRKECATLGFQFPFAKTNRGQGGRKSTKMSPDSLKQYLEGLTGASNVG